MKTTILTLVIYFFFFLKLNAQCPCLITHTSGTQNINGTNITVTSSGIVSTHNNWCSFITHPYYIGYNSVGAQGDGSYTFEFSPPANNIIVNASAISHDPSHAELLTFQVNGAFYPITSSLNPNNCDNLARVTPIGHISACPNCPGSGFKDLVFPGPISSITIKDSLLIGLPMGIVFSIYIADEITTSTSTIYDDTSTLKIYPNPMDNILYIDGLPDSVSDLLLVDVLGSSMNIITNKVGNIRTIDVSKLAAGIYFLSFELNNQIISQKVVKY